MPFSALSTLESQLSSVLHSSLFPHAVLSLAKGSLGKWRGGGALEGNTKMIDNMPVFCQEKVMRDIVLNKEAEKNRDVTFKETLPWLHFEFRSKEMLCKKFMKEL
jgi:hypothetical protein